MSNATRKRPLVIAASLALPLLLTFATATHASSWCTGKITSILTDASGNVYVIPSFRADWIQICSITATWKGVTLDVCKSWLGTVTALRLTQETTTLYYNEDLTCNSMANYGNSPAPGYIAILAP